jgi:putative transposase
VSEQSIYSWGKRYAGMVADAKKRPALEAENLRLKKLLAERDLELEVMKEINSKVTVRPIASQTTPG